MVNSDIDLQKLMRKAIKEYEEDRTLNLINLIMSILSAKKKVQVEEVILEARLSGYSADEVYNGLEKLEKDGLISVLDDGHVKLL